MNPKSAISQCRCTDLLSCVHSRTALLCSLQPHTEMQGWHVKKNGSKMFKESSSHFSYAQFLINFCRIGQVSQHSAPLDTLKAMKLVKGTAATVHCSYHPQSQSGRQRWTYNAGGLVSKEMDPSNIWHTHTMPKKNRSMETIYENRKICNTSDWHLLRCTEEGPRRAMQGILCQCDCQIASINPAAWAESISHVRYAETGVCRIYLWACEPIGSCRIRSN